MYLAELYLRIIPELYPNYEFLLLRLVLNLFHSVRITIAAAAYITAAIIISATIITTITIITIATTIITTTITATITTTTTAITNL